MATITYNKMGPGEGMRPEVTPISVTHAELVAIRDAGNLIPGQFYLITDFVTTTMKTGTRSAGHPFDILVHAVSEKTLSEQAWAVKHDGDTYFNNARLEAWELKYRLDNVQWSQRACTIIEDENDGYTASSMGTVDIDGETYILWDASEFTEDYGFTRLVSLSMEEGAEMWAYDPATGEKGEDAQTSIAAIIGEFTEDGKGIILWLKDEWGNEAGYDFKNVQFKRWKVTDELERENINGHYIGILNNLSDDKQSIEDEEDFIWCYTFAMPVDGSQDTSDSSLRGDRCFNNRFFPQYEAGSPVLYDNVMLASSEDSIFYNNTFSGNNFYSNTFSGNDISSNTFSGNDIRSNTFSGNSIHHNTFSGNNFYSNTFSGNSIYNNTFSGNDISNNTFSGNSFSYNTFSGNQIYSNTFSGNGINNNTFSGNSISSNTFSGNTQYCIFGFTANQCTFKAQNTSQYMQCVETCGQLENQTVSVPGNSKVAIYVGMNSNNQLKIWKPADLAQ